MRRRFLVLSLLCGILCSALFSGEPTPKVVLGFADYQPAVFLQVKAGMSIHLKGITYDQFDKVADSALKSTMPETYLYAVEIDGKASKSLTLAEWAKTETKGFLGFAPTGLVGVVLKSPDGLV